MERRPVEQLHLNCKTCGKEYVVDKYAVGFGFTCKHCGEYNVVYGDRPPVVSTEEKIEYLLTKTLEGLEKARQKEAYQYEYSTPAKSSPELKARVDYSLARPTNYIEEDEAIETAIRKELLKDGLYTHIIISIWTYECSGHLDVSVELTNKELTVYNKEIKAAKSSQKREYIMEHPVCAAFEGAETGCGGCLWVLTILAFIFLVLFFITMCAA